MTKKNYIGPKGPSVCVQHFILVDFASLFLVGFRGYIGGAVCVVPCRARGGGGGQRDCATEDAVHQ